VRHACRHFIKHPIKDYCGVPPKQYFAKIEKAGIFKPKDGYTWEEIEAERLAGCTRPYRVYIHNKLRSPEIIAEEVRQRKALVKKSDYCDTWKQFKAS
jgi:hypothetical protein